MLSTRDPSQNKRHIQTESEELENNIPYKQRPKKAGVTILISDKVDFKTKAVKRDKEGHYIMIKGSIQEEDITIINIYAPNIGAPQYVRQMLTRQHIQKQRHYFAKKCPSSQGYGFSGSHVWM